MHRKDSGNEKESVKDLNKKYTKIVLKYDLLKTNLIFVAYFRSMIRVALFLIVFVVAVVVAYLTTRPELADLKVYNPSDLKSEMVDSTMQDIGSGHKIEPFSFTDQNGNSFGSRELANKIYVCEYFFVNCGTICPRMNEQMMRVHEKFKKNLNVHIVSITVDPENDSVSALFDYAKDHSADAKTWHFLTGKKSELYALARKNFFILKPAQVVNQGDVGSDFIHTNNFVLIDDKSQIRGYYDGTDEKEVNQLMLHIDQLLQKKSTKK